MSRALRTMLVAATLIAAALWTLAMAGAWWALQALAGAVDAGSPAAVLQALDDWTARAWVRHWLDADEALALRDGINWLAGLGGGPAAWLGTALALLGVALLLTWAGGLVMGVLGLWAAVAAVRALRRWWRDGARTPWGSLAAGVPRSTAG